MSKVKIMHIDGESEYDLATPEATRACRNRFDTGLATTVLDPDKPGYLLHWIENFWDGPYSVKDNGNGTYTYKCPYTQNEDTFQ